MKRLSSLILFVVLVVAIGGGIYLYQQNLAAEAEIAQLKAEVADLQAQVEILEKQTVQGVVDEANARVKSGLHNLLEAAEQEFERLQKTLEDSLEEEQPASPPTAPNDDPKKAPDPSGIET
ncbi:hypothetical protein [Halioxenophilus sp. WMMB6]|uniref:hypothetical protein n=1 Tax=Halioxenophilus sp. WMMB6 TaxID=3073815 RepID=UPI00295F0389|nr:hypothetical protein [Halioxenophilus sp. WMMB6]